MLVELVGLPGSGKTTSAVLLGRQRVGVVPIEIRNGALHPLNSTPVGLRASLARRAIASIAAVLAVPVVAWYLLRIRLAAMGWRGIRPALLITFVLESLVFIQHFRHSANGVTVLEEGPVQWVFSLTFGGDVERARKPIARYFRRIYGALDVAFVHLDAVPELCVSRLKSRDQDTSTFNRNSSEQVISQLHAYPFRALIDELRVATGATILVADARQPLATTVDELARLITHRSQR